MPAYGFYQAFTVEPSDTQEMLDELDIEIEPRGESVCIRYDRHCEPVTPGETSVAIDRLLDGEGQRQASRSEKEANAARAIREMKGRENDPFPQSPKG
jgi:hypothetical protein